MISGHLKNGRQVDLGGSQTVSSSGFTVSNNLSLTRYQAPKAPITACHLVVTVCLPERPRATRVAIACLDVSQPPLDLGGRIRHPVRARRGHLVSRQGLRNAVSAAGIFGVVPPAA